MQAVIQVILQALLQLAPGATTNTIAQVVNVLTAVVPVIVQEYKDLLPVVQNIIEALKTSDDITEDQWNALDAMSTQYDEEFKSALEAAKADDAKASGGAPAGDTAA